MHQVFISYPSENDGIVRNLARRLRELGVNAWVYSIDKTLAENTWQEIESSIQGCQVFIFVASEYSLDATGQHRELEKAIDRVGNAKSELRIFPIVLDDTEFGSLPERLRRINGERLGAYNVKSTALKIARRFFPKLVNAKKSEEWRYPRPGEWLEVCNVDQWIEEYFNRGDLVYFRRISPLGLFECYAPKLEEVFWFAPENLRATDIVDKDGALEEEKVPRQHRYMTSYEWESIGLDELKRKGQPEQ